MTALRDRYEALSREELDRYCADQQEENLHLDFKTVASSAMKSKDDRHSLATALSGFANSEGGIIPFRFAIGISRCAQSIPSSFFRASTPQTDFCRG